jgi:hypothetical protein
LRPPSVSIIEAPSGPVASSRARIRARAASKATVSTVRAYAEGRPVFERAACAAEATIDIDVPLFPGTNRVAIEASDTEGLVSNAALVDIVSTAAAARRPELWVVAIGVSRYPNLAAEYQLELADDDARGVAEAFSRLAGSSEQYSRAHVTTLVDHEVTVAAVERAVSSLSAMGPDDVAVVFFAGHGVKPTPSDDMVLLTSAAAATRESLVANGVGWTKLGALLAAARGRVVMLLDACHSGHVTQELVVPNEALAGALAREGRAGVVVFAASKGRQVSYEPGGSRGLVLDASMRAQVAPSSGASHGFFTGALLSTLADPRMGRSTDGSILLSSLVDEVTRRVSLATQGKQSPWVARREMFGDFALARAPTR